MKQQVWLSYQVADGAAEERVFGKRQVFWSDEAVRRSADEVAKGYGPMTTVADGPDFKIFKYARLTCYIVFQRVELKLPIGG